MPLRITSASTASLRARAAESESSRIAWNTSRGWTSTNTARWSHTHSSARGWASIRALTLLRVAPRRLTPQALSFFRLERGR